MVNPALKEQALQLEPAERIELITALTDSLEGYVSPEFAAVLQSRCAEVEADPKTRTSRLTTTSASFVRAAAWRDLMPAESDVRS